jgi:uncharacterized protein
MSQLKTLVAHLRPPRNARPSVSFQALNATRNTVLATRLTLADTPETRDKGLLGRESLPPGEGLWIVPCQAIHMFFMRFPIDLVYIDRGKRVRKVRSNVAPWRISVCLTAYSVLELPAGTVRESCTQCDDVLEISPAPQLSSVPAPPTPALSNTESSPDN